MTRRLVPLLLLSCLSKPIGDSSQRVGVDYDGVRLIGGNGVAVVSASTSCDVLRECCGGEPQCIDYVGRLTETECVDLLEGDVSYCLDESGDGSNECCQADDPCGWADDGVCDCPQTWDLSDCSGGEGEAEAEAEAEPECCSPENPCDWGDDGYCDCPEQTWDYSDCAVPPDGGVLPDV